MSSKRSRKLNLMYSHLSDITIGDQITTSININLTTTIRKHVERPMWKEWVDSFSKEEADENDFHQLENHLPLAMNTGPRGKPIRQWTQKT